MVVRAKLARVLKGSISEENLCVQKMSSPRFVGRGTTVNAGPPGCGRQRDQFE
jgi:hypothetical protein